MAEFATAIGVTAAIVTLIDASTKVYERVKEYKKGTVLGHVSKQVGLLRETLERLRTAETDGLLHSASKAAISEVAEGCLMLIKDLDSITTRMMPADGSSKYRRVFMGIQSFGRERRIQEILSKLDRFSAQLASFFAVDACVFARETVRLNSTHNTTVRGIDTATFYEVPALQVSHFVGRMDLLSKIGTSFTESAGTLQRPVTILLGMGGQGKTQIALEYCNRSRAAYRGIFWIDASSKRTALRSFEIIAIKLSVPEGITSPDSKVDFVKSVLGGWTEPWMLVFDNYDDPTSFNDIRTCFPSGCGSILCTSRHADVGRLGAMLEVGSLSEAEGLDLLLHQSHHETTDDNITEGTMIVQKLGCLALAIDQAAAYITFRHLPLVQFMDHYEKRKKTILEHTPESVWEYRRSLEDDEDQTSLSTLTTWEMSFQQIAEDDNERRNIGHLLTLAAFLNPAKISEDLFEMYFRHASPKPEWMQGFFPKGDWDSDIYQDTICGLYNLSLLQGMEVTGTQISFSLHPMIRGWLQLRQVPEEQQEFLVESLKVLAVFTGTYRSAFLSYSVCVELSSHLESWLESDEAVPLSHNTEPPKGWKVEASIIPYNFVLLSRYFMCRPEGKEELSERLASRNVNGCTKYLGRNHPCTIEAMTQLGRVYQAQGRVEEADAMYMDAFVLGGQTGVIHLPPDLTEGMADVAQLQGSYKKTAVIRRLLFQNSLLTGGDRQSTSYAINAGKSYQQARDFVTAAIFMETAALVLKDSRDQSSIDLTQLEYLGEHYMSRNKLAESEDYLTRCLASAYEQERILDSLGRICIKTGRILEAENYLKQAEDANVIFYGPLHDNTCKAIERLGFFYLETQRRELAMGCFKQATQRYTQSLGPSHPSTRFPADFLFKIQGESERPNDADKQYRLSTVSPKAFKLNDVSPFIVDQPGWDPLQYEFTPLQIELLEWADRALRSTTSTNEAAGTGSQRSELVAVRKMGRLRIIERTDSPQQIQGPDVAETSKGQPPHDSGSMSGCLSMACRLLSPIPRASTEAQRSKQVDEESAQGKGGGKEKEGNHGEANAKGKFGDGRVTLIWPTL